MRLCIPTLDDRGLAGMPSDHFGSALYFTFVDTETGEVEVTRNAGANHVHGACRPLEFLGTTTVDAIVCRGLGRRAFARLGGSGIAVYVTLEKDVEASVAAFKDGHLRLLTSEEACHGQDHGHGHGHTANPGVGRGRDRQRGFEAWNGR